MDDDATRIARGILDEFGKREGVRQVAMRLADQQRGGDAEAISHWQSVLKALQAL